MIHNPSLHARMHNINIQRPARLPQPHQLPENNPPLMHVNNPHPLIPNNIPVANANQINAEFNDDNHDAGNPFMNLLRLVFLVFIFSQGGVSNRFGLIVFCACIAFLHQLGLISRGYEAIKTCIINHY